MYPSSWKLYLDDFPFFGSSLAHLEPELELFEVWEIMVMICRNSNRLVTAGLQKNLKKCHILTISPVLGNLTHIANKGRSKILTKFHNFNQISQFPPNFTISTLFHNFNRISQFQPNFTIPT